VQEFVSKLIGKKIDIFCGAGSSLRGEDGKQCYVAIDKIIVVWEARDDEHRAGFVPQNNK
jgi:hypothetical protein